MNRLRQTKTPQKDLDVGRPEQPQDLDVQAGPIALNRRAKLGHPVEQHANLLSVWMLGGGGLAKLSPHLLKLLHPHLLSSLPRQVVGHDRTDSCFRIALAAKQFLYLLDDRGIGLRLSCA